MSYAPKNFKLEALGAGFTVERSYQGVDAPTDVTQDSDGTWRVKAGARVKVTLTMKAPGRRFHVALVDPLPAGFEVQNEGLATTRDKIGTAPVGWYGMWSGSWFEHDNKRDERVEAFASSLWEGTYTYSYTALATTPGTFLAAPAKAEEMYAPETFGRSGTATVIVEPSPTQL